ncbi:hypothetical protein L202_01491 [Cryptococcus amylolentus CBS 6039]|uniref:Uncharacterized protein n=1 Tax=Cryptococcus amylolentus CBS 6039 TaxID=1295533 RepID=A0A1E3I3U3_9TREE|nr:hypothetical protein L202_01491 [Cryptococcus amylolentus CBS 6039]ODN83330.1 hypothetical protein L202_01491 [Cryptococcus amylolentus CBS 6039]
MFAPLYAILTLALTASVPTLATPIVSPDWRRAGAPENDHSLKVNPTSFCQGQVVNISWVDTEVDAAPFKVQIGVGGYYSGVVWKERYENLTDQNMLWPVNGSAGDSLIFQIIDSLRSSAYLQNFIVHPEEYCTNATKMALSNNTSTEMKSDSSNSTSSELPSDHDNDSDSPALSPNATFDDLTAESDTRRNSSSHPLNPVPSGSAASLKASGSGSKSSPTLPVGAPTAAVSQTESRSSEPSVQVLPTEDSA